MSESPVRHAPRPASVTFAIAFGWLSVIFDLVSGIALLALSGNESVTSALEMGSGTARAMGVISIVFAVIVGVVIYLLGRGSNTARMLVSIVMSVRIGFAAWVLVQAGTHHMTEAIMTVLLSALTLALLWNERANRFFATSTP